MKAVLLSAGEGKRMHPLTYTRPKVMLPVAGKPILEHLLLEFKEAGIKDFLLIIGYHSDTVQEYFGDGKRWGLRRTHMGSNPARRGRSGSRVGRNWKTTRRAPRGPIRKMCGSKLAAAIT